MLKFWKGGNKSGQTDLAPAQSIFPSSSSSKKSERYGLQDPVFEDNNPTIDIIAIHGLNGDRVKTWTDGDVFWLQDLLPNTLKARGIKARIFSYGYNADAYSSSEVSIQDLWGLGEAFLSAVVSQRRLDDVPNRPIVFIAHSLGGLVLKSALIMSNSCNPTYLEHNKALILSTHGIIFCGVPHQGGNGVSEGKILLNASSVVTSTTTNIVRILEPGNEVLRTQRDSFTPISGQFYTVPLFETERTPLILGSSILVVPRDSAVLPGQSGSKYRSPIGLDGKNHITMVKFSSETDPAYRTLSNQLILMLRESFREVNENWDRWRRDIMERDYAGSRLRPKLPHAPNPRFCGREDELRILETFLDPNNYNNQNVVAVYGPGGMGKTELVLRLVYNSLEKFTSILWINASQRVTIGLAYIDAMQELIKIEARNAPGNTPDYSKIATDLDVVGLINSKGVLVIGEDDEKSTQRVVAGIKQWLAKERNGSWLLIFDSHDKLDFRLKDYFPTCSWGSIVITSRRPDIKSYATLDHHYELDGLDVDSAIKLLLSISGRDRSDPEVHSEAQSVVNKLLCLPLAIDQAAAFISHRPQMPLKSYLARYEKKAKELLGVNEHPWPDYELTCMTTWEISRSAIHKESRPAADLLQVCAFFNNDDIWGELLRRSFCFEEKLLSGDSIDDLIAIIYSYSLIKPKLAADTFSMHAVVHRWGLERVNSSVRMNYTIAAGRMMTDATLFVNKQTEVRSVGEYIFEKRLLRHMEYFLWVCQDTLGPVAIRKAIQMNESSDSAFAIRALSVIDNAVSSSKLIDLRPTSEVVQASPLLGMRYVSTDYATDPEFAGQIIDRYRLVFNTFIILSDAFLRQGGFKAAANLKTALLYFMLGSSEHYEQISVLVHTASLASHLRDIEKFKEAELLYRFATAEWPAEDVQFTAKLRQIKRVYSIMLSRLGRYKDVDAIYSELRVTDITGAEKLPDLNDDELQQLSDQAVHLSRQERYAESEALHRFVLNVRQRTKGLAHPDTCLTLNNLALSMEKQGKLLEAEQLHRKALHGREVARPEGHPEIPMSMNNLAVTLKKQGKIMEAAELYSKALDLSVQYQGEAHSATLQFRKNLAVVWASQGHYTRAEPVFATCAKQLALAIGLHNPTTLCAVADWAFCLIDLDRLKGASNLFWYILQVRSLHFAQDQALRQSFNGMGAIRKKYVQNGDTEKATAMDKKMEQLEAIMRAKLVR